MNEACAFGLIFRALCDPTPLYSSSLLTLLLLLLLLSRFSRVRLCETP